MLDNLRDQASSSSLFQDEEAPQHLPEKPQSSKQHRSFDRRIGLTAPQRFFLAFMLFLIVLMLGAGFLVLTGSIVPPFM